MGGNLNEAFLLRHYNLLGFFEEVSEHMDTGEPIHTGYLDVYL